MSACVNIFHPALLDNPDLLVNQIALCAEASVGSLLGQVCCLPVPKMAHGQNTSCMLHLNDRRPWTDAWQRDHLYTRCAASVVKHGLVRVRPEECLVCSRTAAYMAKVPQLLHVQQVGRVPAKLGKGHPGGQ